MPREITSLELSIQAELLLRGIRPPNMTLKPMWHSNAWWWADIEGEIHSAIHGYPGTMRPGPTGRGSSVPGYDDLRNQIRDVEQDLRRGQIREAEQDLREIEKEIDRDSQK